MEDPNFSVEAQKRFDALFELAGSGWTWEGMAHAFGECHGPFNMSNFIAALLSELDKRYPNFGNMSKIARDSE